LCTAPICKILQTRFPPQRIKNKQILLQFKKIICILDYKTNVVEKLYVKNMNLSKDEEVKQDILQAAKRVFAKWGLNKTTMEDIAREAGKGKSTLYYYYKSKEEIFEATATAEIDAILAKAHMLIDKIDSARAKLKKYVAVVLTEIKNTTSLYPMVKGELRGNKEFIEKISRRMDDREEAIIAKILREGIAQGELNFIHETEIAKAANALSGIIRGLEMKLFLESNDNEMIDIVTRLIVHGL
jgi:AcrR family transcriptional regulator